jgi:hypothetical protein
MPAKLPLPVSTTPVKLRIIFGLLLARSRTMVRRDLTGVNTGKVFFAGIIDSRNARIAWVVDTGLVRSATEDSTYQTYLLPTKFISYRI